MEKNERVCSAYNGPLSSYNLCDHRCNHVWIFTTTRQLYNYQVNYLVARSLRPPAELNVYLPLFLESKPERFCAQRKLVQTTNPYSWLWLPARGPPSLGQSSWKGYITIAHTKTNSLSFSLSLSSLLHTLASFRHLLPLQVKLDLLKIKADLIVRKVSNFPRLLLHALAPPLQHNQYLPKYIPHRAVNLWDFE